ncbi:hypothetical protein AWL63_23885 (plasmid) [Sphingomonas panacis]|uniref:Uncharacterized protein n=1 Tax=Sphingomonas panacis TaxID=1560345 RepID=A0A1B3ZIG0_9SPHN|nr:hypothetical protein AWL63_23885 [Sphingomonas panacis]
MRHSGRSRESLAPLSRTVLRGCATCCPICRQQDIAFRPVERRWSFAAIDRNIIIIADRLFLFRATRARGKQGETR